jgi:hypothetical protein
MMIHIVRRGRFGTAHFGAVSYPIRFAPATRMRVGWGFAAAPAFVFREE